MIDRLFNNLQQIKRLLPILVLFIAIIVAFSSNSMIWDETRYWEYATNLSHGFYTNADNPEIRNGPGYPLVIAGLSQIGTPIFIIKLFNALFLFMAVVFCYQTTAIFFGPKQSLFLAYLFGFYPPFLKWLVYLHSEIFAVFLVSGLLYFTTKALRQTSSKCLLIIAASLFLGTLILTKVLFGYVTLALLLFYSLVFIFKRTRKIRRSLLLLAGGFLVSLPFLFYTYSLTGEVLYWGTGSGELLYWRSTPFPNEYGDWISSDVVFEKRSDDYYDISKISENHKTFFQSLEPYSHVEKDKLFKEKAFENMQQYPLKYIQNTVASGMRLFFNYPHSYNQQKMTTYFYILPNGLLLLLILLSMYLSMKNFAAIPFEIRLIMLMALVYLGGIILANGLVRHLLPAFPLLLCATAFVLDRFVSVRIK